MKHWIRSSVLALGLVCASALVAATALADAPAQHQAKIDIGAARKTALARVPGGTLVKEELEKEGGRWIYSFEIRPAGEKGSLVREVNVDSDTGAVVSEETERGESNDHSGNGGHEEERDAD